MNREALLQTLLPGVLIVFVYVALAPRLGSWGEAVNPQPALDRGRQQLRAAQTRTQSSAELARQLAEVQALADEVARLRTQKENLEQQWTAFTRSATSPAGRPGLLAEVDQLFVQHQLRPLDQLPAAGPAQTDGRAQLPASLKSVLERFAESGAQWDGQLYQLRFQGRYHDVVAALYSLARRDWAVLPVGLTMDEADWSVPVRTWTLWVWV